ncbi:FAD-dependent oxidoreductase [Haloarcula sp. CBA1130]|uniref:phytoene desaturase family protein n=1 Tax=unclassified Haloarcula TaxID=2624677 RepID=UPI001245D447|nr:MULTISPECIES: NAD(P)/FAD-dependent oxidoreductase [unclassified Haloarcula]KAA9399967.1 FAD-dependent oxidoreductase [Haloarcula sp. CBA1129]KAA9401662.1 FAD-dependent oxidoreductase [Haloarcula sp. CBA1130]
MGTESADVVVIGGGVAGMSTAARLQADGYSTVVLEQHHSVGGCAGYYERAGFRFDVGATTLVDFVPAGVGGQLLSAVDFEPPEIAIQDAYDVWLPDQTVTLYRDHTDWDEERRAKLGDDQRQLAFYDFIDDLSVRLWKLTRKDIKMPIQSVGDLIRNARAVGLRDLPLARYLRWTMADAMRAHDVYDDRPLRAVVSMLVEDTVHASLDEAPLLNAVLGMTIHRTGLGRAVGGMYGFWESFVEQYTDIGGRVETGRTVTAVTGSHGDFCVDSAAGPVHAEQVVSTVPAPVTKDLAPTVVGDRLDEYCSMLEAHEGSALVLFLGVPTAEVDGRERTHHQILQDYDEPLGNGNNMFVSVSAPGDDVSAPAGHRAVMLSTHCAVEPWQNLEKAAYEDRKATAREQLLAGGRTVYPDLGTDPVVSEVATPVTYEQFTNRPRGAVGGYKQTPANANQGAIPQGIGVEGFYLAGDTTWPGLGTVACVKGSKIAADHVRG